MVIDGSKSWSNHSQSHSHSLIDHILRLRLSVLSHRLKRQRVFDSYTDSKTLVIGLKFPETYHHIWFFPKSEHVEKTHPHPLP